ncbi:MAG: lactate racemase domain-containing protein [Acidobacteriia bacterium]|nr:lactate racemase domain-containing protein [Terriglobia bacterium]
MMIEQHLRTGAWYGDANLHLEFPPGWNVTILWPKTPPPLNDRQILERLERPLGQPRIRELCRGKSRPLVLVDDVNRPTPAARVMPFLLEEFSAAGIPASNVTILMARGSHGAPQREAMLRKIGPQAASVCRLLLHDPYRDTVRIGKTSLGTPVHVNKEVLAADFVMGIGGVYPNNTAGFGGGSKIALGVLDLRVISQLHRRHKGAGWGALGPQNDFRRDLDEIAQMIGLRTVITVHVNSDRDPVRVTSGDYRIYYEQEVAFAREAFRTAKPGAADVVISNAYPNDLSLTFVHMKGIYPLRYAAPGASRIVLGACSEGEGFHGVYPIVRMPRFHEQRDRLRRISLMTPAEMAKKIAGKIAGGFRSRIISKPDAKPSGENNSPQAPGKPKNPIWLYRTATHSDGLPSAVRGMRILSSWPDILEIVRKEQGNREQLNVAIYPCAPLQVLE